ncbi:MAG: N-methyl-L-tryptophan oxidase [Gammaproteobacteria bacterium]
MIASRVMNPHIYDMIVVGAGGLVGSSAFRTAAEIINSSPQQQLKLYYGIKPRVLGIEQFSPPHDMGSSHGESRITRLAGGEGDQYPQLARRSHQIWEQLEAKTQQAPQSLCHLTGGLIVGSEVCKGTYHGSDSFLKTTRECAIKHAVPYENLTPGQLKVKFPQFKFGSTEGGYFETTMGFIRPEKCIEAHLKVAKAAGGELQTGKKFVKCERKPNGKIEVEAIDSAGNQYHYQTKKLILAAGAWLPNLLGKQNDLKVYRQTVYWFEVDKDYVNHYSVGKFPPFIWDRGDKGIIYGFPIIEGNCMKIGTEQFLKTTDPNTVNRTVSASEVIEMYEKFIKQNFLGISNRCIRTTTCLYTKTKDFQFDIDYVNGDKDIVYVSACSGHGAKHSAAVGESLVQKLLMNQCEMDVLKMFSREQTSQLRSRL